MSATISSRTFETSSLAIDQTFNMTVLSTVFFRHPCHDARAKDVSAIVLLENWVSGWVVLVKEDR
jgi:hypothetical protein